MIYGAPVRTFEDISRLRREGFDFGELALTNSAARHRWFEYEMTERGLFNFPLLAHGPLETELNNSKYLRDQHVPNLIATIDVLNEMSLRFLNIHYCVDRRIVNSLFLSEKMAALKDIVAHGRIHSININLENISERVEDLDYALNEIPDLGITLDIGHANLHAKENKSASIIKKLGTAIRHIHSHDNFGGYSQSDDLHLALGLGNIDFEEIIDLLAATDYDGTVSFEVEPEFQMASRLYWQYM